MLGNGARVPHSHVNRLSGWRPLFLGVLLFHVNAVRPDHCVPNTWVGAVDLGRWRRKSAGGVFRYLAGDAAERTIAS